MPNRRRVFQPFPPGTRRRLARARGARFGRVRDTRSTPDRKRSPARGAGVTRLSLDYQIPIANAILTTENLEQAIARQTEKGRDAARVAVEMAHLLQEIG